MKALFGSILVLAAFAAPVAHAQAPTPATAALSACLVRSTTAADHTVLAQWIFTTMARHPSVAQMTTIPDAQRVEINRQMGGLVNRLLLDACPQETRAAVRETGPKALETSFKTLGETAMTTLMGNPDVASGMGEFAAYLDQQRLGAMLLQPGN